MKKWQKIVLSIIGVFVIFCSGSAFYLNHKLNQMFETPEDIGDVIDLGVNGSIAENVGDDKPLNIALFGLDCRASESRCRSDVMMILSYMPKTNEVLITSVARDTYVDIEGYGLDKINHAYAFGGPALAIQTLNRSFDLDIEHYVTVDFWAVEKIVDAVGGVMIDVRQEEISHINANQTVLKNESYETVTQAGLQRLNGAQAMGYARIRYVGNGDFERMERQRKVIEQCLTEAKNLSLFDMIKLVDELLPTVRTNLPKSTILSLVTDVVKQGIPSMLQQQIPATDVAVGKMINSIYYYVPNNLLTNVETLHNLIYPEIDYTPSDTVLNLNERLEGVLK